MANNLSGGGRGSSALEELCEDIGKEVYMDIAGWHLYLRDTKYAKELAVAIYKKVRGAPPHSSWLSSASRAVS